jgi:prolyl 4-hydroxylase
VRSAACALLADLYAGGVTVAQDWSVALDWLLSAGRMGNARALTQLAILQPGEDRDPLRVSLLWAAATRSYATAQALLGRLLERSADAQQAQVGHAWLHLARQADSPLAGGANSSASGPPPAIDLRGPSAIDQLPWQVVRERIDLATWLRGPSAEAVCHEEPSIKGFTGVAPRAACDYLVGLAAPLLRRAEVNDIQSGRRVHHMRTNSDAMIGPGNSDVLLRLVDHRVALAAGLPVANQESTAILRYRPGEAYENHYDFIDPRVPEFAVDIEARGQRVVTALVYLNEDYEGGATSFPQLGIALRGRVGDAIVWRNVMPDGSPEPRSLHAGMPPTQGEKWVLSKWIRSRAQPLAAPA